MLKGCPLEGHWVRPGNAGYARSPTAGRQCCQFHFPTDLIMAVRIRLRREGRKKTPMYRIVVADSQAPRDGRFIEIVGQYQPQIGENAINLKLDRVEYWMNVGALPTDTVRSLLRRAGVLKTRHEARLAAKLQKSAVALPADNGEA